MPPPQTPNATFASLSTHLLSLPIPLLPPTGKPHEASLTDQISTLRIHPSLEALLHILNADLASAHFLVRHMQAAPALEGMYIHGLLHRVEGDYDNARAWYADVCEAECFTSFWGDVPHDPNTNTNEDGASIRKAQDDGYFHIFTPSGEKGKKVPAQLSARQFLDEIERLKRHGKGDKEALERTSRAEIEALLKWCEDKFGTGRVEDATKVWVQSDEEHRKIGQKMVSGGEGYRKF